MELYPIEIIAHRGASYYAPENTLASIKLGWEHQADAVEIDIRLTADKKIMVIHDPNTLRTTGSNYSVATTNSETMRRLDAGSWKSEVFKGETIPFLQEVFEILPPAKKLIIEIKSNKKIVPFLKEALELSGKKSQCTIISFAFEVLTESKKVFPEIPVFYLLEKITATQFEKLIPVIKENNIEGLNLNHKTITPHIANLCLQNKLLLYAWTVDSPIIAKKLAMLGIKAITTNKPGDIRNTLSSFV